MQKQIKVLLVDDHVVVRQGLRALLNLEADVEIVGEAGNGRQAVQMTRQLLPDVVLMDIAMPQMNGMEATRQIVRHSTTVKVLVLSSYSDTEYVRQLTEAGAAGYLVKQTAATDLVKGIHEVRKGNAFFSPCIARDLSNCYRQSFVNGRPVEKPTTRLTQREGEVLQLIAEGLPNKQIADGLSISIKTVEKHRQGLMNKLRIHDIAGLTRHAVAQGIIECHVRGIPIGTLPDLVNGPLATAA